MKKEEVINKLESLIMDLNLKSGDYIVVYGAAMVLRGARDECNDIDVTLTCEAFDRITKENGYTPEIYNPKIPNNWYISYDLNIDLFRGSYGCMTNPVGTEIDNGIVVQTIRSLVDEKEARGREKDINDVKILNDILRRNMMTYMIGKD